jgi:hypothetical protein
MELSNILLLKIEKREIDLNNLFLTRNIFSKRSTPENIYKYIKNILLEGKKSNLKKLLRYLNITEIEIREKKIIPINVINIFGCPNSRDIDVAILVSNQQDIEDYSKGFCKIDIDNLKLRLKNLDYDITREIDINLVYLDERDNISTVLKGSKETQNIIFNTYCYHKQDSPIIISSTIEIDITEKLRSIAKFLLDYLEYFIGKENYDIYRIARRKSYIDESSRIIFSIEMLKIIKIKYVLSEIEHNYMKSLVMKLIQLSLLDKNILSYTKIGLAEEINKIFIGSYNSALWYLMRGTMGEFDTDFFSILISEYERIYKETLEEFVWINFNLNTSINSTDISDSLISEFFKSPISPTEKFKFEFKELYPDCNINNIFQIKCSNIDLIPDKIKNNIIAVHQRSSEWLELLEYYTCGKSSGVKGLKNYSDDVERYYNLIRGAIIELSVINTVDFTPMIDSTIYNLQYHKISVGFIVENKDLKKSIGCAPDLLLLVTEIHTNNKKIIPVEIKCINEISATTHDYRRAIKLARGQLKTTKYLLGDVSTDFGIIVIVTINNLSINGKMSKINL